MYYIAGTFALVALNQIRGTLAQDCPTGYNRTLQFEPCPTEAEPTLECGVLTVPLDYLDTSSDESLIVPVVRVRANVTNPNGEQSIIYNPGGPGSSGISQFAQGGGTSLQSRFGFHYNLLSFDPRGVALSMPFNNGQSNYVCATNEDFIPGPYETPDQLDFAVSNFTTQASSCNADPIGLDAQYIGTVANVRDIVAISKALAGEDGLVRYYGASYGTLMGSYLAATFPELAERILLDGNINPIDYTYGSGSEAVADIDDAVANYFVECAAAGIEYCALADQNQTATELHAEFDEWLAKAKEESAIASDYSSWYRGIKVVVNALSQAAQFTELSQLLYNSYRTDNTTSGTVKRQLDSAPFNASTATDSVAVQGQDGFALYAITCSDYKGPRIATVDNFRTLRDEYRSISFYGGVGSLLDIIYMCSAWDVDAADQLTVPLTGIQTKNPVLFVNTLYDPLTPLISAQNSSAGFIGSAVLTSNAAGHCSNQETIPELEAAFANYFDTGAIPEQRVYNKTTLSFAQGPTLRALRDALAAASNSTADTTTTNGTVSKRSPAPYPSRLVEMINSHAYKMQRRQSNDSTTHIPAGCVREGVQPFTGSANRAAVGLTALFVALAAALVL